MANSWADWDAWCNAHIRIAIEQHRKIMIDAVGHNLARERRLTRKRFGTRIDALERELKELRTELQISKGDAQTTG